MDVYLARQPIFDAEKKIFAYELLFRGGPENAFPDIDGDTATSKLISNSFCSVGIEKITGSKKAFINFTRELLLKRIPTVFPREQVVIEVLEDVEPEEEIVHACREMAEMGYIVALDDFFYETKMAPLIQVAHIIKFDFRLTPPSSLKKTVEILSQYGVKLLAEKVETHEEFQDALDMGFQYFQGYFFSKPEVIQGRDLSGSQIQMLEIMAEANKDQVDFDKLEKIISRDVGMSYKLLRFINSAYYRRVNEISSIKQAVVMLGEKGIRRFLSLIAMAGLAEGKPDELIKTSIIRAKFCELLGGVNGSGVPSSELFTLGLFSLIDAIMDEDMAALMDKLPLSEDLKKALVRGQGRFADYLGLVEGYGKGEWEAALNHAEKLGIHDEILPDLYMEALGWADQFSSTSAGC
jgi:EAL and modified HD-GYP domain-containing signal transduction protein